jgi:hypothetical protein
VKSKVLIPSAVGTVAFVVGLLRLALGDTRAITEVLWAEDGLFPLCTQTFGPVSCTVEPFAGYLLLVPRLSATIVAQFPITLWPLVSVLLAMLVTGCLSAAIFVMLRTFGLSLLGAGIAALTYVFLPLTGLEVIGVVGSLYLPLLVASAIAVIAVPRSSRSVMVVSILLLVTALTTPLGVVVAPFIMLNLWWQRIDIRAAAFWGISLAVGLTFQALTIMTATSPRQISVSISSVGEWTRGFVNATLSLVPGLGFGDIALSPFTSLKALPFLS